MDALKLLVEKKKQDLKHFKTKNDKAWIFRKDIEQEETRRRLQAAKEEEEKQRKKELQRLLELDTVLDKKNKKLKHEESKSCSGSTLFQDLTDFSNKDAQLSVDDTPPPIPAEEVMKRLRRRGCVVTYFGETEKARYKRLYQLELAEHDDDFMGGQKNVFLQLLEEEKTTSRKIPFSKRPECHSDDDNDVNEPRLKSFLMEKSKTISSEKKTQGDSNSTALKTDATSQDIGSQVQESKELRIITWINKMLKLWGSELEERSESEKMSNTGKVATAQYRQTGKDLKPLVTKLKRFEMDADILQKIYDIVVACEAKKYKLTHDKYIELSIGNAAWPMGVTMVGIHERAGRSKIFTSEIAHILNDETTRKYIHMLKRLISFAQRRYPSDPSTMVALSSTHV